MRTALLIPAIPPVPSLRRAPVLFLLLAGILSLVGAPGARADRGPAVWSKASPEYLAWKFGSGRIRNESYVFSQGQFFGGTERDRSLEAMSFLDLVKPIAHDLVEQHYYPADSLPKADLLITVDWGVTTVEESLYAQLGRDNPLGVGDVDAARREANHQMAVAEREADQPTFAVQMMDQTYAMDRLNGLSSDALVQNLDQKSQHMSMEANAALVGFDEDLRADYANGAATPKGDTLRALLADERYFVALTAYDCREYLRSKKLVPIWTTRLSIRALDTDFKKGLGFMSAAGRAAYGHKSNGVEIKAPRVDVGTPTVVSPVPAPTK